MSRKPAPLYCGRKIYITHHAMQRWLEIHGADASFIYPGTATDEDLDKRSYVRRQMRLALRESQVLSYQTSLIFRHPARHKNSDTAEYWIDPTREMCFVIKNDHVVSTIAISEEQYQTLSSLLGEMITASADGQRISVEIPSTNDIQAIDDDIPPSEIKTKQQPAAAADAPRADLTPFLDGKSRLTHAIQLIDNQTGRIIIVIGLTKTTENLSNGRLDRLTKNLFALLKRDCLRIIYRDRVTHLHSDEPPIRALKLQHTRVPSYPIDVKDSCELRRLIESQSSNCPTIFIMDSDSANLIGGGFSQNPDYFRPPDSVSWFAFFAKTQKHQLEGIGILNKKCDFNVIT